MKAKILKRFEDEVAGLERELKMELPKEIQRARELGDLRENAEYQAAKERQTYVQARIGMLRRRMNEIALMNLEKIPHGKAGFGSTVTLRESTGQELVYNVTTKGLGSGLHTFEFTVEDDPLPHTVTFLLR